MYRQQIHVFPPGFQGMNPPEATEFIPRVDVAETVEEVIYIIEIPGAEQNTVSVEISNGTLQIKGQIETSMDVSQLNYLYQERPALQKYSRLLFIPPQVDGEKARAGMKNGILTIHFPKKIAGRRLAVNPLLGDVTQREEQLQSTQMPSQPGPAPSSAVAPSSEMVPPPQHQPNPFYPPGL